MEPYGIELSAEIHFIKLTDQINQKFQQRETAELCAAALFSLNLN